VREGSGGEEEKRERTANDYKFHVRRGVELPKLRLKLESSELNGLLLAARVCASDDVVHRLHSDRSHADTPRTTSHKSPTFTPPQHRHHVRSTDTTRHDVA
jgi:hypothetical protein